MNKKGDDSTLSAIFDLLYLVIVVTITWVITFTALNTNIDDTQTAAHVAFNRVYQSATSFSTNDLSGPLPGTIDPERFTTELLEASYNLNKPYIAMKLTLSYDREIIEAYVNQEEYIRMEPFAIANTKGKGSAVLVEKHLAVSVNTAQGKVPGKLDARIIVSRT